MDFDLPWWAWAQAFVMISPFVALMLWWDWRQRVKGRALRRRIDEAEVMYQDWLDGTVTCPACRGQGRVRRYEIKDAAGRAEDR